MTYWFAYLHSLHLLHVQVTCIIDIKPSRILWFVVADSTINLYSSVTVMYVIHLVLAMLFSLRFCALFIMLKFSELHMLYRQTSIRVAFSKLSLKDK